MFSRLRGDKDCIAYVDLFAGPGRFEDGKASTPLWILNHAIKDPQLSARLVTMFNDKDPEFATRLRNAIQSLPGIEKLTHQPQVTNTEVGSELVENLHRIELVPTLFFIDPWGYKGLSLDLVGGAIRSWGCDCIFFFNYNRINPGINNSFVVERMNDLFGAERAPRLRAMVKDMSPAKRQEAIVSELILALKEVGGKYVQPFEVESQHGQRTSHYIIFVSKSPRGYFIMKDIMFGMSSDEAEVKRFGYVPVRSPQLRMLLDYDRPYSIPALKQLLLTLCAGQQLSVKQVYEGYTVDTPYVLRHVQSALRQLEAEGLVTIDVPAEKRQKRNGIPTLAETRTVTFPQ